MDGGMDVTAGWVVHTRSDSGTANGESEVTIDGCVGGAIKCNAPAVAVAVAAVPAKGIPPSQFYQELSWEYYY